MSLVDFLIAPRMQRVLAALLMHPERDFSLNDLIRLSGASKAGGQQVVERVLKAGLATATRQGNQRRVRVNTQFPIFAELRTICIKTFGVSERIKAALEGMAGLEYAFLFGSTVKGTDRSDSDIDVMAVGSADMLEWSDLGWQLEQELGRAVHLSLYGVDEWRTLLSKDKVMQSIANGPKIVLIDRSTTGNPDGPTP